MALNYAINPGKTEELFYTTGINCEVETATKKMLETKNKFNKKKGIQGFHAVQSFKRGELDAKTAHEIGVSLAEEMWGDRFEVVVSTHLNTDNLHNHFVINSVSFKDGKKYYSNLTNTALLRKTSDELCEEYGLSVLQEKTCKSGINFENFYKKSMQETDYYKFAKEDVDYAIRYAFSLKGFEKCLKKMGYHYYYHAYKLRIRKDPYKRYIRVERAFGDNYLPENINRRILEHEIERPKEPVFYRTSKCKYYSRKNEIKKKYKPKGIIALYYYYKYLLKLYPKYNAKHKLTPEMRAEVKKMDTYSERIRFTCKYKIETIKDAKAIKELKQDKLNKTLNERNRLYYKRNNLKDNEEKDEVTKEIMEVSKKITNLRKEIKTCNDIEKESVRLKEEIKEFKRQNEKKKEKNKKKLGKLEEICKKR